LIQKKKAHIASVRKYHPHRKSSNRRQPYTIGEKEEDPPGAAKGATTPMEREKYYGRFLQVGNIVLDLSIVFASSGSEDGCTEAPGAGVQGTRASGDGGR
jgi:hypothetical protein